MFGNDKETIESLMLQLDGMDDGWWVYVKKVVIWGLLYTIVVKCINEATLNSS